MTSLLENHAGIVERLQRACERVGRDPKDVRLIAVSKRKPIELIEQAYALGVRDFGENYAQELGSKAEALRHLEGLRWHMIGHLQRNKVRHVLGAVLGSHSLCLHTLDSLRLLEELSGKAVAEQVVVETFIAVNLGAEAQKSGVLDDALAPLVEQARLHDAVELVGLMAIPPYADDPELTRPHFAHLRALAERFELPRLSMGMSADFETAIEEGATDVRVGSALFGPRE